MTKRWVSVVVYLLLSQWLLLYVHIFLKNHKFPSRKLFFDWTCNLLACSWVFFNYFKRVWKFSLLEFGFTFTILVIMNNIVKITTKVCHRYYVYSQRHRVSESCVDRKLQVISQELCNGRHGFQRREFQILRGKMA